MKTSLFLFLFCTTSVGLVTWRVHALRFRDVPQFAVLKDPSLSDADDCEAMVGLAEHVIHAKDISPGSTLTILVLGNDATANEPWELGVYSIPMSRKVLEGKTANVQRQENLLRDIGTKCKTVGRTMTSPIFLGLKQAVSDLRSKGCKHTSTCQLFIDSDLQENVEPSIKERLDSKIGLRHNLPPPIDNSGINITFCGLAAVQGRISKPLGKETRQTLSRSSDREDRLRQIWSSVFSKPESVTFEPYCPKAVDLNAYGPASIVLRQ
jgi:hypothetical protein